MISLYDAKFRRMEISRQLQELDLYFEIVDATDGRHGLTPEQEQLVDRPGTLARIEREMTDAEYACALSHLGVWQRILDRDLPGAVILEDDARLDRPFAEFLKAQGYDAAPLVLLDHEKALAWNWTKPVRTRQGVELWRIVGNADRTTGYTISAQGAVFLVGNSLPLQRPADWPCDITPLKPLAVLPRLVDRPEDETESTIEASRRATFLAKRDRVKTPRNRVIRKFRRSWWRKKFLKRFTHRIS
ncbi:glycosyltransferase family 25 protein [Roseovarius sp.]|uniref:glycosyltransferase family 25 protein n=1 Tax=Roseovarius sp. TaxID=1486281 RepID=UPI003562F6C4